MTRSTANGRHNSRTKPRIDWRKTQNLDIFGQSLDTWLTNPQAAFTGWVASLPARPGSDKPMGDDSVVVFSAMWGRLCRFMVSSGLDLRTLGSADLSSFLNDPDLNQEQRWRYARMVRRVYQHLATMDGSIGNPAGQWLESTKQGEKNKDTPFLTARQRLQLQNALYAPLREDYMEQDLKDRTIVAIAHGAGFKVAEILLTSVNCIDFREGQVRAPVPPAFEARRAPLMPWAKAAIERWITHKGISGRALLFDGEDGKPMDSSTLSRAVERVCRRAGITAHTDQRLSPGTLRNDYAAMLFEASKDVDYVIQMLGMAERDSGLRLIAAWRDWQSRMSRLA